MLCLHALAYAVLHCTALVLGEHISCSTQCMACAVTLCAQVLDKRNSGSPPPGGRDFMCTPEECESTGSPGTCAAKLTAPRLFYIVTT